MDEIYTEAEMPVIAKKVLAELTPSPEHATVLCLQGDLGAGKTTLAQAIAKSLLIEETVVSPTFVIAKFYDIKMGDYVQFVHIDAYRVESLDELEPLGFAGLMYRPHTVVIIEWPERIRESIPEFAVWMNITHRDTTRHITTLH